MAIHHLTESPNTDDSDLLPIPPSQANPNAPLSPFPSVMPATEDESQANPDATPSPSPSVMPATEDEDEGWPENCQVDIYCPALCGKTNESTAASSRRDNEATDDTLSLPESVGVRSLTGTPAPGLNAQAPEYQGPSPPPANLATYNQPMYSPTNPYIDLPGDEAGADGPNYTWVPLPHSGPADSAMYFSSADAAPGRSLPRSQTPWTGRTQAGPMFSSGHSSPQYSSPIERPRVPDLDSHVKWNLTPLKYFLPPTQEPSEFGKYLTIRYNGDDLVSLFLNLYSYSSFPLWTS